MKGMAGEVADEEKLFRRVRQTVAGQVCFQTDGDRVVFSQAAFNDPDKEPSLDRASIRADPQLARLESADGIVTLQADAIRKLAIPKMNKNKPAKDSSGRPVTYDVNILSDPRFGNCSHALVVTNPASIGGGAFKRLKEALARLASESGWTIQPEVPLTVRREHPLQDAIRCLRHRLSARV